MANSVDETVCDYLALLLSPVGEKVDAPRVPAPARGSARSRRRAPAAPLVESRPGVDKQALARLLAPVSHSDAKAEAKPEPKPEPKPEAVPARRHGGETLSPAPQPQRDATQAPPVMPVSESSAQREPVSAPLAGDKLAATGAPASVRSQLLADQLDDEFQVLFFKVAGLTLAVPLISLGGIIKLERLTHIMGRPRWYLGAQTHRDGQLNVVDSCAWVMPEKYDDKLAQSVDYQYIVLLQDSRWGLACESLVNAVKMVKSEVNWRTQTGKRPWLAGVVKRQMCGILDVKALIELLNLGLGSQDSID